MEKREADKLTAAITKLAKAVEHQNQLTLEVERNRLAEREAQNAE